MMREWLARFTDWIRRDQLDSELTEELRFHQERLERDASAGGADSALAAQWARRRLGSALRIREDARDRWSVPVLDHVVQDIRYAVRGIRRSPGFAATVILTLGLGIGANATMFGMVDQLMFRPLPYLRQPGQVNRVYLQTMSRGKVLTRSIFPYTRYLALTRLSHSLSQVAGYAERRLALGSGQRATERQVAGVSASFFDFFSARPLRGRFFAASDDITPRGASVAILAFGYWHSEFAGRDVVGESLQVGNEAFTIIGVAPEGFAGVSEGEAPAVFIPITTLPAAAGENKTNSYFAEYNWDWMGMLVRRRDGVSEATASADLSTAYRLSRAEQRAINPLVVVDSIARPRSIAGAVKTTAGPDAGLESRTLLWVSGVALIVLLIACANVTNLMFARVLRRRREVAVRLALGVSRGRLFAQFITESLVLSSLGCAAGLAIAQWGGGALRVLVSQDGAAFNAFSDWRTMTAGAGAAIVAGLLTAIGPALLATSGDLATSLRAGVREGTYQRSVMRSVLLVAQGALSVVLLVGAGLFVRSRNHVQSLRLGYDTESVLMVEPNYRGLTMDSAATVAFRRRLLKAAQDIPGVQFATRVNSRPFGTNITGLWVPGIDSVQRLGRFAFQIGSPDFFRTMGTRIVHGRGFVPQDREGSAAIAVVSEAMAQVLWPRQDPLGQCIQVSFDRSASQATFDGRGLKCATIVGVAEDAVNQGFQDDQHLMYYLPLEQVAPAWGNSLFVRVRREQVSAMQESVRRALQSVMPGQGYVTVQPLETLVDTQRRSWRVGATMFVAFGALALLVAAVGLYGTIAYNVAQRRHELGVRVALGAQTVHIVSLVVSQGLRFAGAGVTVGLLLAFTVSRWIQPLLFEQSARDPWTYAAVGGVLLAVSLLASTVPAIRASHTDPNSALRSD